MTAGESATFTIVVSVPCATADQTVIQNTATVRASGTVDPEPGNNTATAVTTVSNPPPVISGVSASPSVIWSGNHKMVDVTINYSISDNCGTVATVLSVTSNEPVSGTGPDDKSPDWIVLDAHHVQLRAERADSGTGRIYTITITATNSEGGTRTATVQVLVPHDLRK